MKKILYISVLIGLSILSRNLKAQEQFSQNDRDVIDQNINSLLSGFFASLKFNNEITESEISNFKNQLSYLNDSAQKQTYDSLFLVKIDSLKQIRQNIVMDRILSFFYNYGDSDDQSISNFAFDNLQVKDSSLLIKDFAEKYVTYYSSVSGDFSVFYRVGNKYEDEIRPCFRSAIIEKFKDGYKVAIPISIGWLQGGYDTTMAISKEKELYSSRDRGSNITLSIVVYFNRPEDKTSYKLLTIQNQSTPNILSDLQDFLESGIIKNFRIYSRLSLISDASPDSAIKPDFLKLFDNPNKKAIECKLFFTNLICQDSLNITPSKYSENVLNNYSSVGIEINMVQNGLQVEKRSDFTVVKWPALIKYLPSDMAGNIPEELGIETQTNFYFLVKYKTKGLFGKKDQGAYKEAKITDIATYEKEIRIQQSMKKGSLFGSVFYSPMYFKINVDNNSAFHEFNNEFTISHAFGIDGGFYWFGKKQGRFLGIGTGLHYEMIHSGMYLDTGYYTQTVSPDKIPIGNVNVINYEERIWVNSFRQSLKFSLLSIPIMFNYMKQSSSKTLIDIGIGGKISLVNKNGIALEQVDGSSTHKGWYKVQFPDQSTGEYLLEDIPDYGYVTNMNAEIAKYERNINSTLFYLVFRPSFSIPVDDMIKNGFIQLGLNFQYGLNSLYKSDGQYNGIMLSPGKSNDVFSNGSKTGDLVIGFTIGFKYFNSNSLVSDKVFKFK